MYISIVKQRLNDALKIVLITLIILLTGRIGLFFAFEPGNVSLVWPQTGVALALLLLLGYRMLPGIVLGMLLTDLTSGMPLITTLLAGGGTLLALMIGTLLLRKANLHAPLRRVYDVLVFVGFGAITIPAISATIGVLTLYGAGRLPDGIDLRLWFTWWLGDGMGILIVTPVILVWSTRPLHLPPRQRLVEVCGTLLLFVIVAWVVFNRGFTPTSFYPLAYLIFPFLIWGALRFAQPIVVLLTLIVSIVAVLGTIFQMEAYPRMTIWNSLLFLWSYIATISVTALLLAATLTERREIERAVSSLEERFSKAFHSAPVAISISTIEEGRFVDVNDEFCRILGYTCDELIGRTSQEMKIWYEAVEWQPLIDSLRQNEQLPQFETRLRKKTGEISHGLVAVEIIDLQGKPHLLTMFQDITARLVTEDALRESERRYRQLFQGIDDAIFVHDLDGSILDVNEAASRRLGYSRDELLAMKITDLDAPEYVEGFRRQLDHPVLEGQLVELEGKHVTKDGRVIFTDVNSKLIDYKGQLAILALARDITERKLAEQNLRQSEARYRAVVEDQTEFIVRVALDWQIKFVNKAFCRYYDKPREQLIESYFKPRVHAEDFQRVRSALKSLSVENPVVTYEHRVLLDDDTTRWQQWTVRTIVNDAGEMVEYQFVGKDITDLKEAENQRLNAALEHEKVRILADFIAAASHDFRTPLSVISTSAYLLNRADDPSRRERHFDMIQEQIQHIERLVEGLLMMSRLDRGDVLRFALLDLNSLVRQIGVHKRPQAERSQQTLTLDLAPDLPPILADEEWLYRCVFQLVDNAILYTPEGGAIRISTRATDKHVIVEVRDTGIGISDADLPRIFDRLFRGELHRPMGGQGLGLSIAKKIAEGHGGEIEVESALGEGSTFTLLLPLPPNP